jgi:transcription termination factor Rho
MSKAELEARHLADLHVLAAEAGVPRFRLLRRDELIEELLVRGAGADGDEEEAPAAEAAEEPEVVAAPEAPQPEADDEEEEEEERPPGRSRPSRRRRRGRAEAAEEEAEEPSEPPPPEGEVEDEATETVSGVLDVVPSGHGFLRLSGLGPGSGDVYISASQIRRLELRAGDEVSGPSRQPRRGERHPALVHVEAVNGAEAGEERGTSFEELTPVAPHRRLPLEPESDDLLTRAVDLLCPLAFGQRVLVLAEPRSGRTTLLRGIARALSAAPEPPALLVLLFDERPEEVTEWRRRFPDAEIAAASADLESRDQIRLAELGLARAKRRAESGSDVVVLVDSLTRLGVAYRDASEVKPFFGAGRELEEEGAGSLTVIATALTETQDGEGALEAVATTENATVALDAELAAAGVVPAIDSSRCAVSGEEALRSEEELAAMRRLRDQLRVRDKAGAAELLAARLRGSASNAELLASI